VDFTHYKAPTINRRLQRRMVLHKITSIDNYIQYLQDNPDEVNALYQDILIHVTRFFRDPDSYKVLAQKAFGAMMPDRQPETPIRIWVPGCASGEEAYSVAIALQEFLGENSSGTPIQIFGTDVSESAIDQARAGTYPESISADVSADRLRRFFTRTEGGYRINKSIRDLCIFARQDLTRDPPFSKLDLVLCRNVLIYLGVLLQKRLMSVFHYSLKPRGFLMLGSAETVGTAADMFSIIDKKFKLYARKNAPEFAEMGFPVADFAKVHPAAARVPVIEARPSSIQSEANHIILSRYSPPGVVVDSDLQVVHFRGQTGRFLEPAQGDPSLNLLKMAREGLPYGMRTAIQEASKSDQPVRREGMRVRANGGMITVAIEVVPLRGTSPRHLLVLFEETGAKQETGPQKKLARRTVGNKSGRSRTSRDNRRIRELEQELAASREYLQSIIQDMEAANEELQSANEEILSANEELQSTNEELDTAKEELQSTNEELNTVNDELQSRNEELSRVNSDLINLLANVQIAIVMVSSDLRIRRVTPMAERVLNLLPSDVGRSISDIKPNVNCPNLEALISEAVDTMSIKEREVRDRAGKRYSLRIRPYKNVENRIDGAVIALFEIQTTGSGNGAEAAG
jgi:two-component system CheB/CheR fusion protein